MSKRLRQILTASSALLILAGIGASTNNINVNARHYRTHHIYRHHAHRSYRRVSGWHYGMPSILRKNSYWISNYRHNSRSYHMRYVRYTTPLDSKSGVNLVPSFYNGHHHLTITGADQSAIAGIHPHYEALGHGWYRIASGAMHNNLHNELYNTGNVFGGVALIKMHGHNHFSMWYYDNNSMNRYYLHQGKSYFGYFTRYSHSNHALRRVLKW